MGSINSSSLLLMSEHFGIGKTKCHKQDRLSVRASDIVFVVVHADFFLGPADLLK